jgi:hypothetical protein
LCFKRKYNEVLFVFEVLLFKFELIKLDADFVWGDLTELELDVVDLQPDFFKELL